MNTTIKNFSKVLLVAITIFSMSIISSCSKDGEPGSAGKDGLNGAVGAIGAAGSTGATGGTGNTGPAGPTGPTGTANVIYSAWIPANFPATGLAGTSPTRRYMQIPFPTNIPVQSDILNKYLVLVYFMGFGDGSLYMLPCNFRGVNFSVQPNLSFGFLITALSDSAALLNPLAIDPANNNKFRYVLIPGGVPAGRGITPQDYSKMSYHEICTKFNIPD